MNRAHAAVLGWQAAANALLAANPQARGARVSYADTLQAAGIMVGIAAGGPTKEQAWVPFVVGRVDATGPDNTSQLPGQDATYQQLTCLFREWG